MSWIASTARGIWGNPIGRAAVLTGGGAVGAYTLFNGVVNSGQSMQNAGYRGAAGSPYGLEPGTQFGTGYGLFSNPAYALQHPVQATQNSMKNAAYKVSGGRYYPGMEPIDPNVQGLRLNDPYNIGGTVRSGGFDPDFEDPANMPGQVIGGTLTNDERAMIQLMDPKDRARYLLQKRIQEKAEMAVLLSQLQSLRHQTAMSVINNIR